MLRKFALAATAAVLLTTPGLSARAADSSAPAAAPAKSPPPSAKAAKPTPPRKATAAERADAERLAPFERAAFWAHESGLDPTDAIAGLKFAQALRQIGQTDEAVLAAQKVLVLQPNNVEVLLELARDHIARSESFYAIDPLKHAEALAPKDWRPRSLMGVAYDELGRGADARAAWEQALKLSPDNPAVLTNLGLSLAANGKAAEAEPLLRKAAANPAATVQTRQNLALVLGLQGKTAEAESLIRDDVPPVQADADLAWLKTGRAPGVTTAAATVPSPAKADGHTWGSLENPPASK